MNKTWIVLPLLLSACAHRRGSETIVEGTAGLTLREARSLIEKDIEENAIEREVWITVGYPVPTRHPSTVPPGTSYADFVDFLKKNRASSHTALYLPDVEWQRLAPMLASGNMVKIQGDTPSLTKLHDTWHIFTPSRYFNTALERDGDRYRLQLCTIGESVSEVSNVVPDGPNVAAVEFKSVTNIEKTIYAGLFGGLPEGAECLAPPRIRLQEFTLLLRQRGWVVAGSKEDRASRNEEDETPPPTPPPAPETPAPETPPPAPETPAPVPEATP